jgi:hypothetical protein
MSHGATRSLWVREGVSPWLFALVELLVLVNTMLMVIMRVVQLGMHNI